MNRNPNVNYFFSILIFLFNLQSVSAAAPALKSLNETQLEQAKSIVGEMKSSERGPYSRLRWFCNDGTIHPPQPYACKDRGGGRQHAEYSEKRNFLAGMGIHAGTIFSALTWDEFWDVDNRHQRMQELSLEKFMMEIDNGWVIQRARHYRGRIQLEDELDAGRKLLLQLLKQREWITDNYLLCKETVKAVPHHGGVDLTRNIRRRSTEIAETAPSFENIRIEIHTNPSLKTVALVQEWIRKQNDQALVESATLLVREINDLYGRTGLLARKLESIKKSINQYPELGTLHAKLSEETDQPLLQIENYGNLLAYIRKIIESSINAEIRLLLFKLLPEIDAGLRTTTAVFLQAESSRKQLLVVITALINATYGGGLISSEEQGALLKEINKINEAGTVPATTYKDVVSYTGNMAAWSYDNARYSFAESLARYVSLDIRASRFVDDLLRESAAAQLSYVLRLMTEDVLELSGIKRSFFGRPESGLIGLNPGFAVGRIRILSEKELQNGPGPSRNDIVVVPQTVAELKPVAGILTTGEGNLLSHVQLLARNFGIPNVAISHELADQLRQYDDQEILLVVATNGSVVLEVVNNLPNETRKLLAEKSTLTEDAKLQVPKPDLDWNKPVPLADLHKGLSGTRVGPKAANLGELNRLFPGRVSPALALPFGIFYQHIIEGENSPRKRLVSVYDKHKNGEIADKALEQELAEIRKAIAELNVSSKLRDELRQLMKLLFGNEGEYGVFIRSDTNVEDLPGFTGAGLSETVPNVVGFDAQMQKIPLVWSSILSERAISWRSNLLQNPEQVFASVLIMKSVPSDKSGVLVTTDLWSREPGLTVATAWGVGGAVGGESAETIVLMPSGGERLLSTAKSPYKRVLSTQGGVVWKTANDGLVLSEQEKSDLRMLAAEVQQRYESVLDESGNPMPWDIEFGFVNGELTLFQIRPLVERGQLRADRLAQSMIGEMINKSQDVSLNDIILSDR